MAVTKTKVFVLGAAIGLLLAVTLGGYIDLNFRVAIGINAVMAKVFGNEFSLDSVLEEAFWDLPLWQWVLLFPGLLVGAAVYNLAHDLDIAFWAGVAAVTAAYGGGAVVLRTVLVHLRDRHRA